MPKKLAEERKNGFGRDSPNSFPALDEPPGRMKFDLLHPLEFLKTLIGPDLYRKFCGTIIFVICFIVCLGVGWILLSQIIATSIAAWTDRWSTRKGIRNERLIKGIKNYIKKFNKKGNTLIKYRWIVRAFIHSFLVLYTDKK